MFPHDCDFSNETTCSRNQDVLLILNSQSDRCKQLILLILHSVNPFSLRPKIPKTLESQTIFTLLKCVKNIVGTCWYESTEESFKAKFTRKKNNFPKE